MTRILHLPNSIIILTKKLWRIVNTCIHPKQPSLYANHIQSTNPSLSGECVMQLHDGEHSVKKRHISCRFRIVSACRGGSHHSMTDVGKSEIPNNTNNPNSRTFTKHTLTTALVSILLLILTTLHAQDTNLFYINGLVTILDSTEVSSTGPVYTDTETDLDNGGTIYLYDSLYNLDELLFENSSYGKITNEEGNFVEGEEELYLLVTELGTVVFEGNSTQNISGTGIILFNDINLDVGDTLKLLSDSINTLGQIYFTKGFLELNGKEINTYYQEPTFQARTSGTLVGECNESRIVDITGTGSVDMLKVVGSSDTASVRQFRSLGIVPYNASNVTRFKRYHYFDTTVTDTSIGRVFELVEYNNSGASNMHIYYLDNSDLLGSMYEDSLAVWFYAPMLTTPTKEGADTSGGYKYDTLNTGLTHLYYPSYEYFKPKGDSIEGRVQLSHDYRYTAAEINCDELPDIQLPTTDTVCLGSVYDLYPFAHKPNNFQKYDYLYQWGCSDESLLGKTTRPAPDIKFIADSGYIDSTIKFWVDVRDFKGCHSSDTSYITVKAPSKIGLSIFNADSAFMTTSMCVGTPFIIVDTINYDPDIERHTWWFGNDTLDEKQGVLHAQIDEVGTTSINVSYINEFGCKTDAKNWATYQNPYPVADIGIDETVCQGSLVEVLNNSTIQTYTGKDGQSSSIIRYTWKFAESDSIVVTSTISSNTSLYFETLPLNLMQGSEVRDPELNIAFTEDGWEQLILEAYSGAGCTSSDTILFYVNQAAVADIDTSALSNVCQGVASVLVPGDSCANVMDGGYAWTVDPFLAKIVDDTATHIFPRDGNFPVTLEVKSDSGCKASTTEMVTIHPNTKADFEFTDHCVGLNSVFYDTLTQGSNSNTWYFGNGESQTDSSMANSVATSYDTAGTYTVTLITDNYWGCRDSISKEIEIYPLPVAHFESDSIACINAQDMLFTNYIEPGATYHWDFGDNTENNIPHPNKKYSLAGKYYVNLSVKSVHSCTASAIDSIIIRDVVPASYNPANASVCQGSPSSFVPVTTSGLSEVIWTLGNGDVITRPVTNPNVSYTYPASGSYVASLITVSEYSCMDTATYQVLIHPNPEVTIQTTGKFCEGEEILFTSTSTLNPDEIKSYTWLYGDGSLPGIKKTVSHYYPSGNYDVVFEVVTQQSCYGYDTLNLDVGTNPAFPFNPTTPTCETSYVLDAGPDTLDYLWHDGSTGNTFVVTESMSCSLTITNPASSCSTTGTTEVELSSVIDPGIDDVVENCGPVMLNAAYPMAEHTWSTSDSTQIINVNTSGTYSVIIKEGDCVGYDTVDVIIHENPEPVLDNISKACGGNAVVLDPQLATGTFEWNTGDTSPTIETSVPGFYHVTVTNGFGCTGMALTNLTFYPIPAVQLGNDIEVCSGVDVLLNAGNPGASYIWESGDTTVTHEVQSSGEFHVGVTNQWGCTGYDTIQVVINPLPVVDLGGDRSACQGESLLLNAGTNGQYLWVTGEKTREIEVNAEGFYWVRVTDSNSCSALSEPIKVDFKEAPFDPFYFDSISACSFTLLDAGNPNSTYLWFDGNTGRNYLVNESGGYRVQITNNAGCGLSDSIYVIIKPQANLDLPESLEICEGGSDFITADYFGDDYSYNWNVGSSEQYIRVESEGTYVLNVIHDEGCVSTDSTIVVETPSPEIDLGDDILMCANSGLALNAGNPGSFYTWGSSNGLYASEQILELADTGTYWVYVTLPNGCTGSDTVEVLPTNLSIEPLFLAASQIAVGDTVRFVDLSVPEPDTYFWNFGDMTSSTEKEPMHMYLLEDVYTAQLTVGNGTCSASITKELTVAGYNPDYLKKLAREMEKNRPELITIVNSKIYPNPASDYVKVKLEISKASDIAMYLFGLNGQLVKMEKFDAVEELEHSLDVSGLYQGMYFLRISTINEVKTFKILVIR